MSKLIVCPNGTSKTLANCWSIVADQADPDTWTGVVTTIGKLSPAIISAIVAFLIVYLNRRRERRKLTLDLYNEYFSVEFSKLRYDAERYFQHHKSVDWSVTDPFKVDDPDETREGYAAVTRFLTRLSTMYRMKEIDRNFATNLFAWVAAYWSGFVYEDMTKRETMSTRDTLKYIFSEFSKKSKISKGASESEYQRGLKIGRNRKKKLKELGQGVVSATISEKA